MYRVIEKDIFNEELKGKGELTTIGGRMHYLLWVQNKNKYNNFINEIYNPDEVYLFYKWKSFKGNIYWMKK